MLGLMMQDAVTAAGALTDAGLRCPRCCYNLTGLPEPRCPECGISFDWEELRRELCALPCIAFERAGGRGKVPAFVVTWATILFAPWIFGRQIVRRASVRQAMLFAGVCFASTATALLVDFAPDVLAGWLLTAALFLLVQTLCLSVLDVSSWWRPLAALRFWLIVGCYTCAVMTTEVLGPPLVSWHDLRVVLTQSLSRPGLLNADYLYALNAWALLQWGQVVLWLLGVGLCYVARLRRAGYRWAYVIPALVVVVLTLLALYSVAVQLAIDVAARWFWA